MHQKTTHESKEDNSKHENGEKPIPLKDALFLPEWEASFRTAAMLRRKVKKFGLKLDLVTPGKGDCFFVAIIQQLRRPEIYSTVSRSLQQMANTWDHLALRKAVGSFAKSSTEVAARRELLLYAMKKVPCLCTQKRTEFQCPICEKGAERSFPTEAGDLQGEPSIDAIVQDMSTKESSVFRCFPRQSSTTFSMTIRCTMNSHI